MGAMGKHSNHWSDNGLSSNTALTNTVKPSIDFLRSVAPGAKYSSWIDSAFNIER
jgi:hypothetical protein